MSNALANAVEKNDLARVKALLAEGKFERVPRWKADIWEIAAFLDDPSPMFRIFFEAKLSPFDQREESFVFQNLLHGPLTKLLQKHKKTFLDERVSIYAVTQKNGAIVDSPLFQKEFEALVRATQFGNLTLAKWLAKKRLMLQVRIALKSTDLTDPWFPLDECPIFDLE